MVHLQDGWIETPAEVGDIVHVLAHLQEADGASNDMQHALCNSLSGAHIPSYLAVKARKKVPVESPLEVTPHPPGWLFVSLAMQGLYRP